jgi:hypothetical protein
MRTIGSLSRSPLRAVVIYAGEDVNLARELVRQLQRFGIAVWWAEEDLQQGSWDPAVRAQIEVCDALVPVVSGKTSTHQIFTDEWSYAERHSKAVFPVVFDESGFPLGKGGRSHTLVSSREPREIEIAASVLGSKVLKHFGLVRSGRTLTRSRLQEVRVGTKVLPLPSFVFSLSSFETQLHPLDGLQLFASLPAAACLVSAFDVHGNVRGYSPGLRDISASGRVLLLDSGNYEATRKKAHAKNGKGRGWRRQNFWDVAQSADWDLVFSYDHPPPEGSVDHVIDQLLDSYFDDMLKTGLDHLTLCPIVHATANGRSDEERCADTATLLATIAREIRPTLIAIPERELGDGLIGRMRTVRAIRSALDSLEWYQPLHILGTGNPVTMAALAVSGADAFDGLEWCRTAANYENNNLMHFHQFDLLKSVFASRIMLPDARKMVEWETGPFTLRAASYNFDYFMNWASQLRDSVHSGRPQTIFQGIPYVGAELTKEFLNGHVATR